MTLKKISIFEIKKYGSGKIITSPIVLIRALNAFFELKNGFKAIKRPFGGQEHFCTQVQLLLEPIIETNYIFVHLANRKKKKSKCLEIFFFSIFFNETLYT